MIWYTSDLHLGHKNIVKYEPSRTEDFAAVFSRNYVARVQPDDTVFFLGDLAMCDKTLTARYYSSLPGYKILVKGNHDQRNNLFYMHKCGFMEVYPDAYCRGYLLLSHFPLTARDERYKEKVQELNRLFKTVGAKANIHGHTHSNRSPDPRCFNVSVEVRGMAPVSESEMLSEIKLHLGVDASVEGSEVAL